MNAASTEEVVRVIELEGEEFLFYPCRPIDVALVRGTTADEEGNVTMEREAATWTRSRSRRRRRTRVGS